MQAKTFPRGGGKIPHRKSATEHKAIMTLPAPQRAIIPLQQHIGAPCKPLVKVGDVVKIGQKIGESDQYIAAPIHASVSGKVIAVTEMPLLNGTETLSVVIENDGNDTMIEREAHDYTKLSPEKIVKIIKEAGVVGMGGAGFPTYVKASPAKPIDTVLVNGAECEPYLTCDHRLMLEQPQQMIEGLKIMMQAVGATKGIIGVEVNKMDAIKVLEDLCTHEENISVVGLKVKYPQGAEKQLIKAALGREVPSGTLPAEVGCLVNNVHTLIAVAHAMAGISSYERVVTVAGAGVYDPRNLLVRIGTPLQELVDFCGGMGQPAIIVAGGPMTGQIVQTLEGPVVKNLSAVLLLASEEIDYELNNPCIRCARCVDHCPAGLLPNILAEYSDYGMYEKAEKLNIMDCIECGMCSFVCPAQRGVCRSISAGKNGVWAQKSAV